MVAGDPLPQASLPSSADASLLNAHEDLQLADQLRDPLQTSRHPATGRGLECLGAWAYGYSLFGTLRQDMSCALTKCP